MLQIDQRAEFPLETKQGFRFAAAQEFEGHRDLPFAVPYLVHGAKSARTDMALHSKTAGPNKIELGAGKGRLTCRGTKGRIYTRAIVFKFFQHLLDMRTQIDIVRANAIQKA